MTKTTARAAKKTAQKKTAGGQAPKELTPLAKEINTRLMKAKQIEGKADDHRLAAAIRLAEAEKLCKDSGISFKKWVEASVTQSFETVRQLVRIGGADDPQKALEDLRSGSAKANKALRERKKKQASAVSRDTSSADVEPEVAIETAFEQLGDDEASNVMHKEAERRGLAVVSRPLLQEMTRWNKTSKLDRVTLDFDDLSAKDKLTFLLHAAKTTGAEVTIFGQSIDEAVAAYSEPAAKKGGRRKKAA